jgi:NAD(P)-dependent dehydrogenase (short-subunit alcohol dehydrogenase family)
MQVELSGKVALVTGSARGIGEAIARMLANNGAQVVCADVDVDGVQKVASSLSQAIGIRIDVSDPGEVESVISQVEQDLGRLDILINNAGVNTLAHRVTIEEFPLEEWERILKVDLTGLFLVSRAATKIMLARGSGCVVNIASVAGLVPLRLQSPFVAAKAGVVNLTKSMAIELGGRGVRVNCVAPGSVLTEGTKQLFYGDDGKFHSRVQSMIDHIPLGRPGTVEEIASAVLYLCAPEASYVNGAILTVDGGWTAGYTREF